MISFILLSFCLVPAVQAEKYASLVVDLENDEVFHARHADEKRHPASLTKIMTLYLLFDAVKEGRFEMTSELTVSRKAAVAPASKLGLRVGSVITVEEAILALITKSANDVAIVVAENLAETEAQFAAQMTLKAINLGMSDTYYVNASGLHNAIQVTTARDQGMLAKALLRDHEDFYPLFSLKSMKWRGQTYANHNRLLGAVADVDGIKTGFTHASGYNLLASAERHGHRLITIVLGGRTAKSRNHHVEDLLEASFKLIAERQAEKEEKALILSDARRFGAGALRGSFGLDTLRP